MNSIAAGVEYAGGYVSGPNPFNPKWTLDQGYAEQPQTPTDQNVLNSFISPNSGALLRSDARDFAAFLPAGQTGRNALDAGQGAGASDLSGANALNALLPRAAYFPGNVLSF